MRSRYESLSRAELARLLPELLLIGHLIDRSGMLWVIDALGRRAMTEVAIEEWMAASPIYSRRMQKALQFEGDDVVTIFKGIQLDVGAPPQFMDFRFTVHDPRHGEFYLEHCGALMDTEPMGEELVLAMCHDIEDPTFDATAVATNPRAQVRPVHRPPRVPADRHPHCAWTVVIDDAHRPASMSEGCVEVSKSHAATVELTPIDPADEGAGDYRGPLLSDLDFAAFSKSALVRLADEVCLQMHLLSLGFTRAVKNRIDDTAKAREICVKGLTGIAGLGAERIGRVLNVPADASGVLRVLELHPLLNPAAYVTATVADGSLRVLSSSPAHDDGAWISLCGPGEPRPLAAIARAVAPALAIDYSGSVGSPDGWSARVVASPGTAPESDEVAITRISTGAAFVFRESRKPIPLTPA
jgi:hypothetical protein